MNEKVKVWLEKISLNPTANGFNEVHIDKLDLQYKPPLSWIEGAVQVLHCASVYLKSIQLSGVVAAAFALESSTQFIGVNYHSCVDLQREFCLTPPSLYHFREGQAPWQTYGLSFQKVEIAEFPIDTLLWELLHLEYKERGEPEYRRSLWLAPRQS